MADLALRADPGDAEYTDCVAALRMSCSPQWLGRHPMLVVELNFAGYRFTHRVHDRRWSIFRPGARAFGWRPPQFRRTTAA